jgi:hypothetical protein
MRRRRTTSGSCDAAAGRLPGCAVLFPVRRFGDADPQFGVPAQIDVQVQGATASTTSGCQSQQRLRGPPGARRRACAAGHAPELLYTIDRARAQQLGLSVDRSSMT